jgi:hypothetical protein
MKSSNAVVPSIIPFQSADLFLVDHHGEPFVPMKRLVEGIGLNWKYQRAKLAASTFGPSTVKVVVVVGTGKRRSMVCLPLRKLLGWLGMIKTSALRPNLQRCVDAYRHDCDDVLWRHWRLGQVQRRQSELQDDEAIDMASNYLSRYHDAVVDAGGTLPKLDVITESRMATRLAMTLLRDKRWLVTFSAGGNPELMGVPSEAGIFTPEKILRWIREPDGACSSFIPDLLCAIGDRLKTPST